MRGAPQGPSHRRQYLDEDRRFSILLQSLDNRISLNFFTDLLDEVAAIGIADNKFISRAMILTIQDTPLGKKFAAARTYPEFYEVLKASTPLLMKILNTFFSISDTGMDLVTKPSELYLQGTSGRTMESAKLLTTAKSFLGTCRFMRLAAVETERSQLYFSGRPAHSLFGGIPELKPFLDFLSLL